MPAGVLVAVFCFTALAQDAARERSGEASVASRRSIIGDPAGLPLRGETLEKKTTEVAALLRCPVCQGLSIADSPAAMAVNMKREVRDLLAEGYSGDQVLAYFEKSYGEFVRLQPPLRGFNWLVWLAPLVALMAGVFIVMRFVRRGTQNLPRNISEPANFQPVNLQPDTLSANPDPYLDQLRQLAYTKDEETAGRPRDTVRGEE